jgi:DNA-binding XRE family transcriptional regulator
MEFAEIVRRKREKGFKTPTEFHRKAELSCSYQAYTAIEKGEAHPKIELALEIVRKLGLSERQALLAWARGLMPDVASQSVFTEAQEHQDRDYGDFARSKGVPLSGAQVKYLVGEGPHVDILRYLSARLDLGGGAAARDIAKALSFDSRRITKILAGLEEQGLIEKAADDHYRVKNHWSLPDSPEAGAVKHALFERTGKMLSDGAGEHPFRATLTRRLSGPQVEELRSRLTMLLASADALPSPDAKENVYTIGVFALEQPWRSQ